MMVQQMDKLVVGDFSLAVFSAEHLGHVGHHHHHDQSGDDHK